MNNPKIKFCYVIIKHLGSETQPNYAVHEAYKDLLGDIIAVSGEPVTLWGHTARELVDTANIISGDIAKLTTIEGDCEELFDNFDRIL